MRAEPFESANGSFCKSVYSLNSVRVRPSSLTLSRHPSRIYVDSDADRSVAFCQFWITWLDFEGFSKLRGGAEVVAVAMLLLTSLKGDRMQSDDIVNE
jgi:hypothetical protein